MPGRSCFTVSKRPCCRPPVVYQGGEEDAFVQFVLSRLGAARLAARGGVLDVGGGDGRVARLFARAGVRATVIDPVASPSLIDDDDDDDGADGGEPAVAFVRARFGPEPLGARDAARAALRAEDGDALDRAWLHDRRAADSAAPGLLASCAAVVGYRACEATSAIVEFAAARRLPVAIAPCCVHPVASGVGGAWRRGRSLGEMCALLRELAPPGALRAGSLPSGAVVLFATFDDDAAARARPFPARPVTAPAPPVRDDAAAAAPPAARGGGGGGARGARRRRPRPTPRVLPSVVPRPSSFAVVATAGRSERSLILPSAAAPLHLR